MGMLGTSSDLGQPHYETSINDMKVTVTQGSTPILVGFPHSGQFLPPNLQRQFTAEAQALPDGDASLPELFQATAVAGCSTVTANFSRYLIDVDEARSSEVLNPGPHDSLVCPLQTRTTELPIYLPGYEPDQFEVGQRAANYWQPFHDDLHEELLRIKHQHGVAILLTIKPMLPAYQEPPMAFSVAADRGSGCDPALWSELQGALSGNSAPMWIFRDSPPSGYLAKNYGSATKRIHALEISINRSAYQKVQGKDGDEHQTSSRQTALQTFVQTCTEWAIS